MNSAWRLAGQPHDRVVRLHPLLAALHADGRHLPLVFPVVEHVGPIHVVGREHRRLDREDRLRVAHPLAQAGRHLRHRRQQAGKGAAERRGDRIARVDQVEGRRPVVGVDHDLDAVADVVDVAGALGVRVAVAGRVGVLDPEQPALIDRQVRVAVVFEERRDQPDAIGDAAVIEDPALARQVVGEQRLHRSEAQREQQLAAERSDPDAARPRRSCV